MLNVTSSEVAGSSNHIAAAEKLPEGHGVQEAVVAWRLEPGHKGAAQACAGIHVTQGLAVRLRQDVKPDVRGCLALRTGHLQKGGGLFLLFFSKLGIDFMPRCF